jgi:hypothetical protein
MSNRRDESIIKSPYIIYRPSPLGEEDHESFNRPVLMLRTLSVAMLFSNCREHRYTSVFCVLAFRMEYSLHMLWHTVN